MRTAKTDAPVKGLLCLGQNANILATAAETDPWLRVVTVHQLKRLINPRGELIVAFARLRSCFGWVLVSSSASGNLLIDAQVCLEVS